MKDLISRYYTINGVTLHVKEGGDVGAPAILFLHGFPSFWYSWQQQIDYFLSLDYRVIVPDQRGYNESSKPTKMSDYRLTLLIEDIVQLLQAMGVNKVFVVAHDWGGIIAWALLKTQPQLIHKAVIINAPYLPSYSKPSWRQLRKSWYVYFFQLPRLPEWMVRRNGFSLLVNMMRRTSLPGTFSERDMALYKEAWNKKESLTAMINWYRALAKYSMDAKEIFGRRTPVPVPIKVLWGIKDAFLEKESGTCPSKHCPDFTLKEYPNATHWLPTEKSETINNEIHWFFSS